MTAKVPSREDLAKLDGYDLEPLPGGFYVDNPECLSYRIECGATLTDSAVAEIQSSCSPPLYDVDNDGYGEYVLAIDWDEKKLEIIKNVSGKWKALCYSLKKKPDPIGDFIGGIVSAIMSPFQAIQNYIVIAILIFAIIILLFEVIRE